MAPALGSLAVQVSSSAGSDRVALGKDTRIALAVVSEHASPSGASVEGVSNPPYVGVLAARSSAASRLRCCIEMVRSPRVRSSTPRSMSVVRRSPPVTASG